LSDFLRSDSIEVKKDNYKSDIGVRTDISVLFKIIKISDDKVYVNGKIKGLVYLECSRCLCIYAYPINTNLNTYIKVIKKQVNVGEEIRQLLMLEIPMKPICSISCRGICKVCGRYNKDSDFCSCKDEYGELEKERWKELLNKNGRRK